MFNRFSSHKNNTYAKRAMVATSSPLAAQAGLEMIKLGGKAVDAALATAIALTVVEPTSNGIGGDAFAIVHDDGNLYGLNSSGPAPKAMTLETLKQLGHGDMPAYGALPVTVPGTPAAWKALSERFGRLPFKTLFEPAIRFATEGYIVSDYLAFLWQNAYKRYSELNMPELTEWFKIFAPMGRAPKAGELWQSLAHAQTLRTLAETDCQAFYHGAIANAICQALNPLGNPMHPITDLQAFTPEWVKPISIHYRGYDIHEMPPNGQGISALMALNILKHSPTFENRSVEALHTQIEAMKQAYTDVRETLGDQRYAPAHFEYYLSHDYGQHCAAQLSPMAASPIHTPIPTGGTVYLCTADAEGQMVSFIQSNYMGFGSGIVVPDTGIALHNRGHNFTLKDNHPNMLMGGKRPLHTIIPGFITKAHHAIGPFGVMGGFMQPQGHLQVITNLIDFRMSPQEALDAPRWQWIDDKHVYLEATMPTAVKDELEKRGHQASVPDEPSTFGRGQIIMRLSEGGYIGGTETRCDGTIAID